MAAIVSLSRRMLADGRLRAVGDIALQIGLLVMICAILWSDDYGDWPRHRTIVIIAVLSFLSGWQSRASAQPWATWNGERRTRRDLRKATSP